MDLGLDYVMDKHLRYLRLRSRNVGERGGRALEGNLSIERGDVEMQRDSHLLLIYTTALYHNISLRYLLTVDALFDCPLVDGGTGTRYHGVT